jgi:alpha-galactosidase
LEKLAAEITREGGVPGIWIAATAVNVYTRLFRDHEDWFVRDRNGKILEETYGHGQTVHLDITHLEVEKYLRELFTRLHSYGFRIFKVDFTQHVTINGGFYRDGTVPRGGVLRKLFEVIRESIGPDSYLFTCGAPFESVTGLADSVRVSGDVHNHWSHVLLNMTSIAARWWMNRRLWNNDPDFLIIRTAENSPGVPLNRPMNSKPFDYANLWRSGREFDDREAQSYALLVLLSGGEIMLSDHLPVLNEAGRNLIQRVLDGRLTQSAVPLDLFDSHEGLPSLWLADEKDHWLVGLFNWEEDAREIQVDLAAHGITPAGNMRSFWDDGEVRAEKGIIQARLEPRECMGIRIDKRA